MDFRLEEPASDTDAERYQKLPRQLQLCRLSEPLSLVEKLFGFAISRY
jgi:hypothetical protein